MKTTCSCILIILFCLYNRQANAQSTELEPKISTAVPFLLTIPDSRSSGMGDIGAATTPDVNDTHHNVSKLAFTESTSGVGLSYTPWLQALGVKDMFMAYVSGYHRLDDRQTLAASFRYFTFGEIPLTDELGNTLGSSTPNEFAVDIAYVRKLSENFSMGLAARYIHTNLYFNAELSEGDAIAADVSTYYHRPINLFGSDPDLSIGLTVSNLGGKIQNGVEKSFLPTNLKLGTALTFPVGEESKLMWGIDVNKRLVPSNATMESSIPENIFNSLGEFDFDFATGLEYHFIPAIAIRGGFYSDNLSGTNSLNSQQYFSAGAGLEYNNLGFNLSYLIPATAGHPLERTLRYTLTYSFGKE